MFSIAIQAGGHSRRMGRDKALLSFQGQPLIQRVLERLRPIADEILVTTNRPEDYRFLAVPLYSDLIPERGALGGLYTALSAASRPLVGVVACDMPFVSANLVAAQLARAEESEADIVIPQTEHGLEPLHAVYRPAACLPHIAAAIQAEKWRVDSWFHQVNIEYFTVEDIIRHDPRQLSFRNTNTPEELERAVQLAKKIDSRKNLV